MKQILIILEAPIQGQMQKKMQSKPARDIMDHGGGSSFRSQLPPTRKWTKSHTHDLIIGYDDNLTLSAFRNMTKYL